MQVAGLTGLDTVCGKHPFGHSMVDVDMCNDAALLMNYAQPLKGCSTPAIYYAGNDDEQSGLNRHQNHRAHVQLIGRTRSRIPCATDDFVTNDILKPDCWHLFIIAKEREAPMQMTTGCEAV